MKKKEVNCFKCGKKFANRRLLNRHFAASHKPPRISSAINSSLEIAKSKLQSSIIFKIKQTLINRLKLSAVFELVCDEYLYLSLFYKIDRKLFQYKFHPVTQTHIHMFQVSEEKSLDSIIEIVSKVLGQDSDDWLRRYHLPWQGGYQGASYISLNPNNKKRSKIIFKSFIKTIKEPMGPADTDILIHQLRFLKLSYPTYLS
jgi:hypothetical protein